MIKESVRNGARVVQACKTLNLAYTTYLKWEQSPDIQDGRTVAQRPRNPRALTQAEEAAILTRYCQPDVCDMSVRQAHYALLDQGTYLASESTVYRVFRKHKANVRRDGVRKPTPRHKPTSFVATGPNQVWSWDITYLRDADHPMRFYYAFVAVDIYSRYVVHADVFAAESAENAVLFLRTALDKHHIRPRALVVHSDNGSAMKSAATLALLERYQVRVSRSRPRVSDDNPYSEALFKTMKYAGYMGKQAFRSLEQARNVLQKFVSKYNDEWVHSGINNVTPQSRFNGQDALIQMRRNQVLQHARLQHPERWIRGAGKVHTVAGPQYLNPDKPLESVESSPERHLMEGTRVSGEQAVHWRVVA